MGGDTLKEEKIAELKISIHAPRVGGDVRAHHLRMVDIISIHAPRVGGDVGLKAYLCRVRHFNPRPPCGGRLCKQLGLDPEDVFQSTPPVWGATSVDFPDDISEDISIHAPRVGGDVAAMTCPGAIPLFQSTPPVWGATYGCTADG